jgi:hypothetical protein
MVFDIFSSVDLYFSVHCYTLLRYLVIASVNMFMNLELLGFYVFAASNIMCTICCLKQLKNLVSHIQHYHQMFSLAMLHMNAALNMPCVMHCTLSINTLVFSFLLLSLMGWQVRATDDVIVMIMEVLILCLMKDIKSVNIRPSFVSFSFELFERSFSHLC